MAQYKVALVNMTDGSVQGHKAGCADLKRGANVRKFADEAWELEVANKHEAWEAYNSDFIAECYQHESCDEAHGQCVNAYDIKWLPCAGHVPDFAENEGEDEEPDFVEPAGVSIDRRNKWTVIHGADGTLIAKIRNDQIDFIRSLIS